MPIHAAFCLAANTAYASTTRTSGRLRAIAPTTRTTDSISGPPRELADSALALARAYEAPTATGIALRTLGQLTGDLDALAEAAGMLAGTQTRLEHARALVELGAALRRANHRAEAREPL